MYRFACSQGWDARPGVTLVHGRWQDVIGGLGPFDGIFFDTCAAFCLPACFASRWLAGWLVCSLARRRPPACAAAPDWWPPSRPPALHHLMSPVPPYSFLALSSRFPCSYGEYYEDMHDFHQRLPTCARRSLERCSLELLCRAAQSCPELLCLGAARLLARPCLCPCHCLLPAPRQTAEQPTRRSAARRPPPCAAPQAAPPRRRLLVLQRPGTRQPLLPPGLLRDRQDGAQAVRLLLIEGILVCRGTRWPPGASSRGHARSRQPHTSAALAARRLPSDPVRRPLPPCALRPLRRRLGLRTSYQPVKMDASGERSFFTPASFFS